MTNIVSNVIPTLAMFATYATYTVVMKEELSGSFHRLVFTSKSKQRIPFASFQDLL